MAATAGHHETASKVSSISSMIRFGNLPKGSATVEFGDNSLATEG
jgi:hypothetical protein